MTVVATQTQKGSFFGIPKETDDLTDIASSASYAAMEENGNVTSAAHDSEDTVNVEKKEEWNTDTPTETVTAHVHFLHAADFVPMVFNPKTSQMEVQLIHRSNDGNAAGDTLATIGGMIDPRDSAESSIFNVIKAAFMKQNNVSGYDTFIKLVKESGFDPETDLRDNVESDIEAAIREGIEEAGGTKGNGTNILDLGNGEDLVKFIKNIGVISRPLPREYNRTDFRFKAGEQGFEGTGINQNDIAIVSTAPISVTYRSKQVMDDLAKEYSNLDESEVTARPWSSLSDLLSSELASRKKGQSQFKIDGHFDMIVASALEYVNGLSKVFGTTTQTIKQLEDAKSIVDTINELYQGGPNLISTKVKLDGADYTVRLPQSALPVSMGGGRENEIDGSHVLTQVDTNRTKEPTKRGSLGQGHIERMKQKLSGSNEQSL